MAATPPIILFTILAWGSVQLKIRELVGDPALVSLLVLSGFFAFIFYFKDRIKKLALTGVELRKAVQDVHDAEARIKDMARRVADRVEAANKGSWKDESYDDSTFNKAVENVRNI